MRSNESSAAAPVVSAVAAAAGRCRLFCLDATWLRSGSRTIRKTRVRNPIVLLGQPYRPQGERGAKLAREARRPATVGRRQEENTSAYRTIE